MGRHGLGDVGRRHGYGGGLFALAEYKGELYAGGSFTYKGDGSERKLGRWNGATWSTWRSDG